MQLFLKVAFESKQSHHLYLLIIQPLFVAHVYRYDDIKIKKRDSNEMHKI